MSRKFYLPCNKARLKTRKNNAFFQKDAQRHAACVLRHFNAKKQKENES